LAWLSIMSPVRIHLGPMPEMLRTIVTDLLRGEDDMTIVGSSNDGAGALFDARNAGADVFITEQSAGEGHGCLQAILAPRPLAIFALSSDGTTAAAVSLVAQSTPLGLDSGQALATAVRDLARRLSASPP